MTFNEGMQIDTSTASSSGGGIGGMPIAIGGGLGGLLILIVALFLGVDPGGITSQQPMDTGGACRTYNVLLAEDRQVAAALIPIV